MSKWIVYEVANTEEEQPVAWACDECGEVVECQYNYCPNCGDAKGGDVHYNEKEVILASIAKLSVIDAPELSAAICTLIHDLADNRGVTPVEQAEEILAIIRELNP